MTTNKTTNENNFKTAFFIIALLFFIFGFVTWVNGTLISFFKKAFGLDNTSSYLVTFAFFISYTVMAIPASEVLKKIGFKNGMSLGLGIMSLGTLIFVPAARMESYELFLLGLFTIGTGLTLLQTASNPYVTILGPRESAAQRISFMGINNKLAGILGQWLFGSLFLAGGAALSAREELQKVEMPYLALTVILAVLAFVIRGLKDLPEVSEEQEEVADNQSNKSSIFQFPHLLLGALAIFFYVGAEVIAIDTLINYGKAVGFAEEEAKNFGTYGLWAMLAGYVCGIVLIPKFVSQSTWLRFSAIIGILFTLIAVYFTSGFSSVLCIAILGFANAVMWPAIWPLAIDGLGKFTKTGAALLIMGISGGALLPLLYGKMADNISAQSAYLVLIPCYLFILYFAQWGHKVK